jgi:enterochelin esterase-like enzyme
VPATPAPVVQPTEAAKAEATPKPPPTPTPVPTVRGTPVAASEPLQGFLLDDKLTSPIINGESFAYRVYLPPDYLRSVQRRYPVMYMLHGNGGNYTEWTDSYLPEQVDRLIVTGEVPSMIVVMPDDAETTYWANWSDGGPRWADYVTFDVVNTIDQRYRTLPHSESRAIGGLSMGGLGALNLAFKHPDVFGVVGAHSPSVRLEPDPMLWFLKGDDFWENNPIWLAQHRTGLDTLKIWIDDGSEDVWLPNIEAVHDALVEEGLNPIWHVYPGPHEAEYWIEHLPDYLRFYGSALRT